MNDTQLYPFVDDSEVTNNNQPELLIFSINYEARTTMAMNKNYRGTSVGQENKGSKNEKITKADIQQKSSYVSQIFLL